MGRERQGGKVGERERREGQRENVLRTEVFQKGDWLFGFCLSFSDTLHLREGVIHYSEESTLYPLTLRLED